MLMLATLTPKEQSFNKLDSRRTTVSISQYDVRGNGSQNIRNDIERLSWKDSLAVQELLNVISQIIADEYVAVAKKNPQTFTIGE